MAFMRKGNKFVKVGVELQSLVAIGFVFRSQYIVVPPLSSVFFTRHTPVVDFIDSRRLPFGASGYI
jgi:hypothetical protein